MLLRSAAAAAAFAVVAAASAFAGDPLDPAQKLTAAGQARAAATLLTKADLGAAWSGGAHAPTSFKAPRCPAYSPNDHDLVLTGHAEATFNNGNGGIQVDADVEVFATGKDAAARFDRIVQPKLATCLRYDLAKSIPRGSAITILQAKRLQVGQLAQRFAFYRVPLLVKTRERTATVYSDFLYLGAGRIQAYMNVVANAVLRSQLRSFELRLAKAIATRL